MERAESIELLTFDNGMKAVLNTEPCSDVDYFGISFRTGSSDEKDDEHGLAHFVEHTIFKGTSRHKAGYILNRIEELGGELNAFTNKEETVVYTICPSGNLGRCMSLVAEIVSDSIFPEAEIEKERQVILEEIDSYLDSPSDAIFDELDESIFRGTPLAHNILGTVNSVMEFTTSDCIRWVNRHFNSSNAVVFYSGAKRPGLVARQIEKYFSRLQPAISEGHHLRTNETGTFDKVVECPGYHQCHVVTAFRVPGIESDHRPELILLCNILGGPGMNSLLNLALREKRGLVYQVDASTFFYSGAGEFVVYYGCDKENRRRCGKITEETISRIVEDEVSPKFLSRSIRQYLGQLSIAYENREQRILSAVKAVHCRGKVDSYSETCRRLAQITPGSLHEAARYLSSDRLCRLTMK